MKNFRLDDESGHQEALFSWAGYNMGRMPELEYMHHVPNGGKRDRATAVALKRQGRYGTDKKINTENKGAMQNVWRVSKETL